MCSKLLLDWKLNKPVTSDGGFSEVQFYRGKMEFPKFNSGLGK